MSRAIVATVALVLILPAAGHAQAQTADNPLIGSAGLLYQQVKGFLTRSADQVPEAEYAFRPTEDVRTFGQILAHVANAQYMFCSTALGEENPSRENFEQTKTTKAEIQAALAASFQYCDRAYSGITDAQATQTVNVFGAQRTKLFALNFNVAHNMEHYGNLVTYMRIRGIVPPSSQRGD